MALSWSNPAAGRTAIDLRNDFRVAYRTAFTLAHKLREGLTRGFNVGILCGVQEMDGADLNGKRYREKRNKPLGGGGAGKPKIPEHLLKPTVDPETGEIMGPPKPPKFDKTAKQPEDRRLMLVMRQRGLLKGRGAVATRISIALKESTKTVVAMATKFASAESRMMSDEDPAYATFSRLFAAHGTVNHSKTYSAPRAGSTTTRPRASTGACAARPKASTCARATSTSPTTPARPPGARTCASHRKASASQDC